MSGAIRKCVFPAAGLGTRCLPATKVLPKEMLVLVDKPLIQYGVEEAAASGIEDMILVTGRGKSLMEDHFDAAYELEALLERRGRQAALDAVRATSRVGHVSSVRQGEPLGLGHAVLASRGLVGDEPFAVVLTDDVVDATPPALRQLIDVYERLDAPVLAVERVPADQISSYGVVSVDAADTPVQGVHRITQLVEKPRREDAPSDLAVIGRYVLTPDVFPALEATAADRSGEIQLTDGLRRLLESRPIYACEIAGVRHDTGNRLGLMKAQIYFALQRPELAEPLRRYVAALEAGAMRGKA